MQYGNSGRVVPFGSLGVLRGSGGRLGLEDAVVEVRMLHRDGDLECSFDLVRADLEGVPTLSLVGESRADVLQILQAGRALSGMCGVSPIAQGLLKLSESRDGRQSFGIPSRAGPRGVATRVLVHLALAARPVLPLPSVGGAMFRSPSLPDVQGLGRIASTSGRWAAWASGWTSILDHSNEGRPGSCAKRSGVGRVPGGAQRSVTQHVLLHEGMAASPTSRTPSARLPC